MVCIKALLFVTLQPMAVNELFSVLSPKTKAHFEADLSNKTIFFKSVLVRFTNVLYGESKITHMFTLMNELQLYTPKK